MTLCVSEEAQNQLQPHHQSGVQQIQLTPLALHFPSSQTFLHLFILCFPLPALFPASHPLGDQLSNGGGGEQEAHLASANGEGSLYLL